VGARINASQQSLFKRILSEGCLYQAETLGVRKGIVSSWLIAQEGRSSPIYSQNSVKPELPLLLCYLSASQICGCAVLRWNNTISLYPAWHN